MMFGRGHGNLITYIYSFSCISTNFQVTGCNISTESITVAVFYIKTYVTKFDLAVKYVKVNPGASFEQTMMGWSPKRSIPSFMEIGPPIPEKKIFEGFLPHMGLVAMLVM